MDALSMCLMIRQQLEKIFQGIDMIFSNYSNQTRRVKIIKVEDAEITRTIIFGHAVTELAISQ